MRKFKIAGFIVLFGLMVTYANAQEKWDLLKCVEYAKTNNISVKQADVQKRFTDIQLKQNKYAQYPNASFNANTGYQFGRSIDPTTNLFTNQQLLFQGYQLNASVPIFNWNRITNDITSAKYNAEAADANIEKVRNDISLTVAAAYLQALLAKVQADITHVQLEQTKNQLADTRKRVDAGTVPELNALDLEAQASRDSSNMLSAQANYELNLLNLKAYMNLDFAVPFDIVTPPIDAIPIENIADLQPEVVYQLALKNQPAQKANELKYQSLLYASKAAKANLYPTFSAFGGLATNFSNGNKKVTGVKFNGYAPSATGNIVNVSGTAYDVLSPNYTITQGKKSFGEMWNNWGSQMNNNFRQNIGVSVSVPIMNGYQARSSYERSKVDLLNQDLVKEQSNQKLKQDIYTAYSNAVAALQKYNASKSSLVNADRAYVTSKKRYEIGLLSTLELITSQSNLNRARFDVVNAQFDYVFKMKVLEFYKGQGIKLN